MAVFRFPSIHVGEFPVEFLKVPCLDLSIAPFRLFAIPVINVAENVNQLVDMISCTLMVLWGGAETAPFLDLIHCLYLTA